MAESPPHKFGQIIGKVFEKSVYSLLKDVADEFNLYLDWQKPRKARGGKSKVSWVDSRGNSHDLDYVLEDGGTEEHVGKPRAFIEIAYRRYTKHSRNKAQEIEGAIIPLAETYRDCHPFLGAVLAGVFTKGSIQQLESNGFGVLYFTFEDIVAAFAKQGIDARFDENTPDSDVQKKVNAFESLPTEAKELIAEELKKQRNKEVGRFARELKRVLSRKLKRVVVFPLHGKSHEVCSIDDAISYINRYEENSKVSSFVRYEIIIQYTNGDEVRGDFVSKTDAIKFLNSVK